MLALIASLLVAGTLATAGAMKLAEPAASRVALATYGLNGRAAAPAWVLLVVVELGLAVLVLVGLVVAGESLAPTAAVGAAVVFAGFVVAGSVALARGRGGAPCGCLGARGALSPATVTRAGALCALAVLAAAPLLGGTPAAALNPATVAPALVLLGVLLAVGVAGLAALLLHRAPRGALQLADEGPEIGAHFAGPTGLVLFTSDGCGLCARVKRGLRGADVTLLDEERDADAWLAAKVPGAPYALFVGADGTVLNKGAVNTGAQVRSLVPIPVGEPDRPIDRSRRSFLARGAGATAALTAGGTVGRLVRPGEAEAYHFCGHIYTTDSCPHPTGLPRIDAKGFPLRAKDGHRVDDLGRLVDSEGYAVGEDDRRLRDPDGRPLERASRTRVCAATARAYGQNMQVDGAWYRCCKGHVRKLVDCCTEGNRRINGDKALTGYCYKGRKVFCVMFFQTKVPC